jgi:hypothetical protein
MRARLRVAYHSFRERAALLAAEIPQDLREFTVHDATHLDALWELSDLISGPEISLTPTEGFVLGGAFLIHDLGMGLAAWPGGLEELKQDAGWRDILATCLADLLGRQPRQDELRNPPPHALRQATEVALRESHAAHAADLALISWKATGTEATYHLIQDEDLRNTYGHLIGQLAASHWWNLDHVVSYFPETPLGAPVDCPDEWIVDSLKLACLLRLADIAHVDARRAPSFLRAIRSPSEPSDRHWAFQGHLQRPRLEGDRLIFTAAQPFAQDEAAAWWLCYETLQAIDRELHSVDSLFADKSRPRMAARSVKGADSPFRLRDLIPTVGWTPVDARVVVTNVPALVRKLGGPSLYGENPRMALRELIQNASDATRALCELLSNTPAPVKVCLRKGEDDAWYLDVIDSGVGMSQRVLTGPLLDFGRTYWGSELMREELPGLASSGFRPTGRFGIGFYSVFMLGESVKVISRRYDEASADTRVLEFEYGLDEKPIVRPATREEVLNSGGTIISVRLNNDPHAEDGLLALDRMHVTLRQLCARLAPALPSDLVSVEPGGSEEFCVRANDWISMDGADLLRRTGGTGVFAAAYVPLQEAADRLRIIEEDGEIIARAAIAPSPPALQLPDGRVLDVRGVLAAGGLEIDTIGGVAGIFTGSPVRADRSAGDLRATMSQISAWSSEQAKLWEDIINEHKGEWDITVTLLARLGADMAGVHVCCSSERFLSAIELRDWAQDKNEVIVFSDLPMDVVETPEGPTFWYFDTHQQFSLDDNMLVIRDSGRYGGWEIWGDEYPNKKWEPEPEARLDVYYPDAKTWWYYKQLSLDAIVLRSIADAWGYQLDTLLENIRLHGGERVGVRRVSGDGKDVRDEVLFDWRVHRPS